MSVVFVVAFVLALLASIALHEAGHLITAKHYGHLARQYFVGFGPTLWSFQRGETEYGIKAIPAGGFVKIAGMTQLEEMPPQEADRAFWRQPARQRLVVLSAGSMTHFVLAIGLVVAALAIGGAPANQWYPSTTVSQVLGCVPAPSASSCPATVAPAAASPAARAGLRAGDTILAVDGVAVRSWDQLSADIRGRAGEPTTLRVGRGGAVRTVTLVPVARTEAGTGAHPRTSTVGFVGIVPATVVPRYGPVALVHHSLDTLGEFVTGTASGLVGLPRGIVRLAEGKPRGANSPAGVVDLGRLSGQIGAAPETLPERVGGLLLLLADLNLFVGVFNLLPLLPLDGGHVAILLFEAARTRLARLVGRPDPGRVDISRVLPVAYVVIALFAGLSLLLVYAGIANPIRLQ
jgi:membrane-associated protease RseP (regulator of RpoE activity)